MKWGKFEMDDNTVVWVMFFLTLMVIAVFSSCKTTEKPVYGFYREYNPIKGDFDYKWGYHYKIKDK
jgi:hypothetical protein